MNETHFCSPRAHLSGWLEQEAFADGVSLGTWIAGDTGPGEFEACTPCLPCLLTDFTLVLGVLYASLCENSVAVKRQIQGSL